MMIIRSRQLLSVVFFCALWMSSVCLDDTYDDLYYGNQNIWDIIFGNSEGSDSGSRESRELPDVDWLWPKPSTAATSTSRTVTQSTTSKATTAPSQQPSSTDTNVPVTTTSGTTSAPVTESPTTRPTTDKPSTPSVTTDSTPDVVTDDTPDDVTTKSTPPTVRTTTQSLCTADEFQCRSGQCITKDYKCDGLADCTDGSDEQNCLPGVTCPEGQFHCRDNTCVTPDAACNGVIECPDGSDEDPLECGLTINKCMAADPLDVIMVVQGSSSITERNYTALKCGIVAFIESMKLADGCVKMGMVHFSDKVYGQYAITNDTYELRVNVYNLPALVEGTSAGQGIKKMRQMFASQGRKDVPKIGVVFMYGQTPNSIDTLQESLLASNAGINLVAVGIGDDINRSELQAITIRGGSAHQVGDFEKFKLFVGDTLVNDVCSVKTPPVGLTTQSTKPITTPQVTTSKPHISTSGVGGSATTESSSASSDKLTTERQEISTVVKSNAGNDDGKKEATTHLLSQYFTTQTQPTIGKLPVITTPKPNLPGKGVPPYSADMCEGCKMMNGAGYNPHPRDCSKYVHCTFSETGSLVSAVFKDCPFGQYWDQHLLTCDLSSNVVCHNDPCIGVTGLHVQYDNRKHCGAYFECSKGHSVSECCPPLHSYFQGRGCIYDPRCDWKCPSKTTPTQESVTGCDKRASSSKYSYDQMVNGAWMTRPCAPGTTFNPSACKCSNMAPDNGQVNNVCKPELELLFDDGLKDTSGNHVYITNDGVRVKDGRAVFNGRSRLLIQRFTNDNFGETLVIRLKYRVTNDFYSHLKQALVSNSDCGQTGSVVISKDRSHVNFDVKTDKTNSDVTARILKPVSEWKTVEYTFSDGLIKGSVNGVGYSQEAPGSIETRRCALQIGHGLGLYNFVGEIDEIKIYKCKPKTPYHR